MHRKTTSRREDKRLVSKRQRAAERQAINGGHLKVVRDSWAYKVEQPPIINEVPKGHPKRKRAKAKKVSCPQGPKGKHEYLKDVGVFETYSFWYTDPWPKQEVRKYKMCVHCGEIRFRSHSKWGPDWYKSHQRLLRSANDKEREGF